MSLAIVANVARRDLTPKPLDLRLVSMERCVGRRVGTGRRRTSNRRTPTVAFSNTVSWRVGRSGNARGRRERSQEGYVEIGRPSGGRAIELGVSYAALARRTSTGLSMAGGTLADPYTST